MAQGLGGDVSVTRLNGLGGGGRYGREVAKGQRAQEVRGVGILYYSITVVHVQYDIHLTYFEIRRRAWEYSGGNTLC